MRGAVLVVAVCGCNQALGLHQTKELDAHVSFFDAPTDAPFTCPPTGTAPAFSPLFHQLPITGCYDYTLSASADLAVAVCGSLLGAGAIDQAMQHISLGVSVNELWGPRLDPEGDQLFAYSAIPQEFRVYTQTAGTWTRSADLAISATYGAISVPTRRPNRRVMVTMGSDIHELVETGDNVWTDEFTHTLAELSLPQIAPVYLSPDGLRLLAPGMSTGNPVLYADRAAVGGPFNTAVPLAGVPTPLLGGVFMTEDCSRIYLYGLDTLFYVQRQ